MTKKKMYRYLGRNGILTTHILIDGAKYIPMMELIASPGMVLSNGSTTLRSIVVEEAEVANWHEVTAKND